MATNLLNGNFEADWELEKSHRCVIFPKNGVPYEKNVGNIFTPPYWTFWFYHDPGKFDQPEGRDAWAKDFARRAHGGAKGYSWFTFSRNHDAGLFQQVTVGTGAKVRFTIWMHGWSNNKNENLYRCWNCGHSVKIPVGAGFAECAHCRTGINRDCDLMFPHPGDGKWSEGHLVGTPDTEGVGYNKVAWPAGSLIENGYEQQDAKSNHTFKVGIDPTGGTNPLANTVVWGDAYHIYNGYVKQLEVEATASADTVTVFVRSTTKYNFTHNDIYVDDAELVVLEPPVVTPPEPDEIVLGVEPLTPKINTVILATATSNRALDNVQFVLAFEGKNYPITTTEEFENNGVYTWTCEFSVTTIGLYSLSVESDTCSDVVSFTAIIVPERGEPRVDYERTYVLMPPDTSKEWVLEAIANGGWDEARFTIGGSADDAGIGNISCRRVIAVNPDMWPDGLHAFFEEYYPGVEYVPIEATLDTLGAKLREALELPFEQPASEVKLGYPTTHLPPLVTNHFGVPSPYADYHIGIDLRSSAAAWGDRVKAAYAGKVILAGDLGDGFGTAVRTQTILPDGREMLIRYAHLEPSLMVKMGDTVIKGQILGLPDNTGLSTAAHLHFDVRLAGTYVDPEPLIEWPDSNEPESNLPHIYGVHEDNGNEAALLMKGNGISGYIVYTEAIGTDKNNTNGNNYKLDCSFFGHTAIARLNNGYGSSGTVPPESEYGNFVVRTTNFVRNSQGCNIWIIGNEPNNNQEWPGNSNGKGGTPITPESFAALFNLCYAAIHEVKPDAVVMPGAVDGYNAQIGYASTEYMRRLWVNIKKADAVCMHAYTHGPNKALITAETKFGNAPQTGIFYDFLNFDNLRAKLPNWAWNLPVYITETNHLWHEDNPNPQNPTFGWVDARNGWIPTMYEFVNNWNKSHAQKIRCACLYRWPNIDKWVITGKKNVIADFVEAMGKKYKANG